MVSSLWPSDDNEVAAWGEGLVRLVGRFLPKKVQVVEGTAFEQWPLVGPAYIAKASGTLETMFMLFEARRTLDATLLLRNLYENLLVFSWIAMVPEANLPRWIKSVCREAIKTDDDWRRIGMGLLDEPNRDYAEARANDELVKCAPDRAQMAEAIDRCWDRTYPGHPQITGQDRDFLTFRGLYRHVYRFGSDAAHQNPRSLRAFYTNDGTGFTSVHREKHDEYYLYPWLFAAHATTLGLAIASSVLGWPSAKDVWCAGIMWVERPYRTPSRKALVRCDLLTASSACQ